MGSECWLGSQTSDKVHRASRGCSRQSGGPCVDHFTTQPWPPARSLELLRQPAYHIGPCACPTGKYSKGDAYGKVAQRATA